MKKIIHIALLIIITSCATKKQISSNQKVDLGLNYNLNDYLTRTASIETITLKGEKIPLGSGVLLLLENENDTAKSFVTVLTDLHLFEKLNLQNQILIGFNSDNSSKNYFLGKIQKIDPQKDLCLIIVVDVLNEKLKRATLSAQYVLKSMKFLKIIDFAPDSSIEIGKEVFSLGYPLAIGASSQNYKPLYRAAHIAQKNIYGSGFVLDGIGSFGNSGSPIYDKETGKFIGLIQSRPDEFREIKIDTIKTLIPENSGIINCISAQEILNFLTASKK